MARNVPVPSGLAGNTRHTSPLVTWVAASRPKRATRASDTCCEPAPPRAGIGIAAGAEIKGGIGIAGEAGGADAGAIDWTCGNPRVNPKTGGDPTALPAGGSICCADAAADHVAISPAQMAILMSPKPSAPRIQRTSFIL